MEGILTPYTLYFHFYTQMENTTHTLENLFKLSSFRIPQYQRAYAWEDEPQLTAFLDDLRQQAATRQKNPEKSYFLGTLLLHEIEADTVDVVDGQQRMTTSVVFIAAALKRHESNAVFKSGRIKPMALKNYFVHDDIQERQKFQTIHEDNPFFRSRILGLATDHATPDSPSSKRLRDAFAFFLKHVADDEWESLIETLITAKVMVYSVNSSADATLIFELQNDRGKRLTELEALKSYLMHLVYLHSKNPDDHLGEIQTQFAKIYRIVEALDSTSKAPSEDAILSYHCVSYLRWTSSEWRAPKDLIKQTVRRLDDQTNVTDWVLNLTSDLRESFLAVQSVLQARDKFPEVAELMLLDRMASFWPLAIKAYRADTTPQKSDFRLSCRLMEVYALRGYGLSNLRSDAGLNSIYTRSRDFQGDFTALHGFLHGISHWYDVQNRFVSGLQRRNLYRSNRKDVQYLLWRYENHLRSQTGKAVEKLGWRAYVHPVDDRSRFSLEHIAAQDNPISDTKVSWEDADTPEKFSDLALHRLGNLVIDSKSSNSSKGNGDFSDKLEALSKDSTFLSQGELIDWADTAPDGVPAWTLDSIKKRQSHLLKFALRAWDPSTYFTPTSPAPVEEEVDANLPEQPV